MVTTTANIEQEQINQRASGSDGNGNSVEAMLIPRRDCFAAAAERTSICTEQQQQQQAASLFAAFTLSLSLFVSAVLAGFAAEATAATADGSILDDQTTLFHSISVCVYVIVIRAIF